MRVDKLSHRRQWLDRDERSRDNMHGIFGDNRCRNPRGGGETSHNAMLEAKARTRREDERVRSLSKVSPILVRSGADS